MWDGGHTSGKGNISELKVLTAYAEAGFLVALPFGGGAPYDLMVDLGRRVLKVQVKTGRLRNGCVLFPMQRFSGHTGKARHYDGAEFDYFAVYCPDTEKIYVLPLGNNATQGYLRCEEAKNKQRQGIHWAKDYEFENHVRELRKEMELDGLEPSAS